MPNKDLTELVFILDRSGSMQALIADMREAIDGLVEKQKKEKGRATFTLWAFDTDHSMTHTAVPLEQVEKMSPEKLFARGGTALCDAIVMCLGVVGKRLNDTREDRRPGKVIVTIMTDGAENSSQKYSALDVNKVISEQRDKYGWEILFIGANVSAYASRSRAGGAGGLSVYSAGFTDEERSTSVSKEEK